MPAAKRVVCCSREKGIANPATHRFPNRNGGILPFNIRATPPPSPASPVPPRRNSGAGAIFPGRKSSSATSSSSRKPNTSRSTSTNGNRNWLPRFCAALSGLTAYFLLAGSWSIAVFAVAYLAGGWFTAQEVWERLQQRAIDVHFLMLAVAVGSASIGAWAEGTTLLFLFSLSGALEHFALGRTQKEIRSLFREAPKFATVLDDAGTRTRSHRSSSCVPACGCSSNPARNFPSTPKSSRARPLPMNPISPVKPRPWTKPSATPCSPARSICGARWKRRCCGRRRKVRCKKSSGSSSEAQHQKAPAQQFTDRFGTYYTYIVLGLSFAMFFVWWLGFGLPPFASERGAQRVLSGHDAAGRRLAVRAGAVDSFGGAGGHRVERAARHSVPRRRGGGKTGGGGHGCARQDRHAHDRRIARGNRGEFSTRTRNGDCPARLLARTTFHASARPRDHALRQTAAAGAGRTRTFRIHHRPGPARPA